MSIPKQLSNLLALAKLLTFFKSREIITVSHFNSTNFNDNFKHNFMREKVNKMASNVKTLNICALGPNWKWIHDDLIWSCKNDSHDAILNFNQHWWYLSYYLHHLRFFHHLFKRISSSFLMSSFTSPSVTSLVCNTASKLNHWDSSQK